MPVLIRPVAKDYDAIRKRRFQKRGVGGLFVLGLCALASFSALSDYAEYLEKRRSLCEQGKSDEAYELSMERNLVSTIVAYIDEAMNGDVDPCETIFPAHGLQADGLFDEYPPLVHFGGLVPHRPTGTIAYALTITRCPEIYAPPIDENPDPGDAIYEATVLVKDEICNTTATLKKLREVYMESNFGQTLYGIVNPNGVTCLKPGTTTVFYDRVSMLQDMGYRVEIVGQPITNDMLEISQPYINDNIEDDVGIRHSTMLHGFRLIEHPVVVMFNYDRMLRYRLTAVINALIADPNLKGYYVRNTACDEEGHSNIDTGFLVVKPSMDEFNAIVDAYLLTEYDPETGWNGEGYHHCDGRLGLPGFLSYYFDKDPGYKELDRCVYSFVADDECIKNNIQNDAKTATDIADVIENGNTTEGELSEEAEAVLNATNTTTDPIDEVRLLPVDEEHPNVTATVIHEGDIVVMEVYVAVVITVKTIYKRIDADGNEEIIMVLNNDYSTTRETMQQLSTDPSLVDEPQIVEEPAADALIRTAVTGPIVVKQSTEICGKPTECPPDDPEWTHTQRVACEELHSSYFIDKRRAELNLKMITTTDLVGQFKPRSFHGYCTGPGHENYIGIGDVLAKPDWQIVCEPMICPYNSYVTSDCTCSDPTNPCSACPSGTRCQLEPVLMCIDCQCGFCGAESDTCCQSGGATCSLINPSEKCLLDNNFFASVTGGAGASVCDFQTSQTKITAVPNGCGCTPNNAMPCTYDPGLQDPDVKCFQCTSKDIVSGVCPSCKSCLSAHDDCINSSTTEEQLSLCLALIANDKRALCLDMCTKF